MREGEYNPTNLNLRTKQMYVASFTPWPLYIRGRSPGTHWIGGWVESRVGLDVVAKRGNPITAPAVD